MKNVAKKSLIISGGIIGGIVAFIVLMAFLFVLLEPAIFNGFYKTAAKEFDTPGKDDGFVQQGLEYVDGTFLTCGYMGDGKSASRIYITEGTKYENRKTEYVCLYFEDGSVVTSHAGGLSHFGDYVYLCDSEGDPARIIVFSLDEILAAQNGGKVFAKGFFEVDNNASFCYVKDGTLYVGEYYKAKRFPTKEEHAMTAPDGSKHAATIFGYYLDENGEFGLQDYDADFVYSICDTVQGMCITDGGQIVLSTSFALMTSHHYYYDLPQGEAEGEFSLDGREIPLWYLDSNDLTKDVKLPPMSEEIVFVDGRIYVMNESACNKYIFGKLLRAKYIWSYAA